MDFFLSAQVLSLSFSPGLVCLHLLSVHSVAVIHMCTLLCIEQEWYNDQLGSPKQALLPPCNTVELQRNISSPNNIVILHLFYRIESRQLDQHQQLSREREHTHTCIRLPNWCKVSDFMKKPALGLLIQFSPLASCFPGTLWARCRRCCGPLSVCSPWPQWWGWLRLPPASRKPSPGPVRVGHDLVPSAFNGSPL